MYTKYTVYCNYLTQNGHKRIVTLMLQRTYISLSYAVLAFAGPGVAIAQTDLVPVSYSEFRMPTVQAHGSSTLDTLLLGIANDDRAGLSLARLEAHDGLSAVARAHARDMSVRGYVGYTDPSGLSLFDLVRQANRTALIGSFGSSIAVLNAGASPAEIHAAIQSDPANAEILRRGFGHAGVGTYTSDGRLYVVQLFAQIDGELKQPLPMQLTEATVINPSLNSESMTPVGWSLDDQRGDVLARGSGRRVQTAKGEPIAGYLNLEVAVGNDVYTLRGPFVQVN